MANTLRVSIQPNNGATRVIRIAQPSLRVTVSKGSAPAPVRTPAERAADGEVTQIVGYTMGGVYDDATMALIAAKQLAGWPDYAIWVRVMGESAAGTLSATASIPAFGAWATFTPPSVTALVVGETVSASATIPALTALASFTVPSVTGIQTATSSASGPQFSAVSTFAAPTVYATRNATATVPQFAASATFAQPNVTVTPAGAAAAAVTVPSLGAVAAFTSPSVTAQVVATASVPLFSATSTLTAPNVAATRVATASVPSFGATAAFTAPTAAGVQQAAAVSATVSVPSFAATATFAAPSVAGVQQSAAPTQPVISATGGDTTVTIAKTSGGTGATSYDLKWGTSAGSKPNIISGVTLPYTHTGRVNGTTYYYSLVAVNVSGSTESVEFAMKAGIPQIINEGFELAGATFPYTGEAGVWTKSGTVSLQTAIVKHGTRALNISANGQDSYAGITHTGLAAGRMEFWLNIPSSFAHMTDGMFYVKINGTIVYSREVNTSDSWINVTGINYGAGTNVFRFGAAEGAGGETIVARVDSISWIPS